jgi:hypothetical protein
MPLFLLIPLGLLVLTIALAPVLAVAVVPDREARSGRHDPVRLPRSSGGTAGAPGAVEAPRDLHRAA